MIIIILTIVLLTILLLTMILPMLIVWVRARRRGGATSHFSRLARCLPPTTSRPTVCLLLTTYLHTAYGAAGRRAPRRGGAGWRNSCPRFSPSWYVIDSWASWAEREYSSFNSISKRIIRSSKRSFAGRAASCCGGASFDCQRQHRFPAEHFNSIFMITVWVSGDQCKCRELL